MNFVLQPWQILVVILTGWLNRQQQLLIDFLLTEVQVLKETCGDKRIRFSDDQRCRLAVRGRALGRKALQEIATIVTPDTILRWHRQLVAAKWDYSSRRKQKPGWPPVSEEVTRLILRMARENPTWGYDRIQGAQLRASGRDAAVLLPRGGVSGLAPPLGGVPGARMRVPLLLPGLHQAGAVARMDFG